jgi:hypothetical protein
MWALLRSTARHFNAMVPIASGHQTRFHQESEVRTDSSLEERGFELPVRF